MPVFRIHRMKDSARQHFLWAPHVSGAANAKPRDYDAFGEIEADSDYAAWAQARASEKPLLIGDILETPSGHLRICKYVGFEDARWVVPEPVSAVPPEPAPAPQAVQA